MKIIHCYPTYIGSLDFWILLMHLLLFLLMLSSSRTQQLLNVMMLINFSYLDIVQRIRKLMAHPQEKIYIPLYIRSVSLHMYKYKNLHLIFSFHSILFYLYVMFSFVPWYIIWFVCLTIPKKTNTTKQSWAGQHVFMN